MAAYDHGGGCACGLYKECDPHACGLYKECDPGCREYKDKDFDKIMEKIVAERRKPYVETMKRPWGEWQVLDVGQGYKVKRLEILPDQSISLQYHNHRSEHWTIVQGKGRVIVDGNIFTVEKGDSFHVSKLAMHKIANTHLNEILIAIEVQMGEICSEDDIVRC